MAKITQHSPKFGMPSGTDIVPGVKAKCENCGVEFITEGNESFCIWRINHADVGWAIICPTCGGDVHVRHPLMPESAGVKENRFTFCFVATCCFGDLDAPEVIRLRRWRDEILANSKAGRQFTAWYYSGFGKRAAEFISRKPVLRRFARAALGLFIRLAVK